MARARCSLLEVLRPLFEKWLKTAPPNGWAPNDAQSLWAQLRSSVSHLSVVVVASLDPCVTDAQRIKEPEGSVG